MAGLEKALNEEGPQEVELAIRRILLIHGVILTAGGIPLVYLGDEIGTLNDYSFRDDPAHDRDSRWVHRPRADWEKYQKRSDPTCIEGRVYQGLQKLLALRKEHEAFSGGDLEIIPTQNEHVLGFARTHEGQRAVIFANFSEYPQSLSAQLPGQYLMDKINHLHGLSQVSSESDLVIQPLDFVVFGN